MSDQDGVANRSVLIADQNEDFLASFKILLESAGYQVRSTRTGSEFLRLLNAHRFHALVLSIALPDAAGHELARHARRDPKHADALIIALTGWNFPGDASAAADAGFDHFLLKPIDFAELERRLEAHFRD